MEDPDCTNATEINALAKALRLELKEWEQSFAAAHQGRKVGREDIKQYPEIGQKFSTCRVSQSLTDANKHTNTNSTINCEDPLPNRLPLIMPLP